MENRTQPVISFAPLQEYTDFVYRKAHAERIGGVDRYFAPYMVIQKDGGLKKSHMRDTDPENCTGYRLIPQVMAGHSTDFLLLAEHLTGLGYGEINWNLGCPYPMVTGKGMGAGLLPHPGRIREILDTVLPHLRCKLSVKFRSGLESGEEIFPVIEVLNDFPLSEVIFHPRVARQMYHGTPDLELFGKVVSASRHQVVYNGDLLTEADWLLLSGRFEQVSSWMIGRGLLQNPFLAREIKESRRIGLQEKATVLSDFHDDILNQYATMLSGQSHLLVRMTKFWEHFSYLFPDQHKAFKRVKKSTSLAKYHLAVRENFQRMREEESATDHSLH